MMNRFTALAGTGLLLIGSAAFAQDAMAPAPEHHMPDTAAAPAKGNAPSTLPAEDDPVRCKMAPANNDGKPADTSAAVEAAAPPCPVAGGLKRPGTPQQSDQQSHRPYGR